MKNKKEDIVDIDTKREIEHFKKTGIPRCHKCLKNFKLNKDKSGEYNEVWEPDCKCLPDFQLCIG